MAEKQHDITSSMQRRSSGLLVPENAEPEVCPHPPEEVEQKRHSYFCKRCQQKVALVTVATRYMTTQEVFAFQHAQRVHPKAPNLLQ